MGVKSGRRRQRLVLALLVVVSLTAACGDDDGAADEAAGDVDAYCALVSEAKALSGHVAETEDPAELEQLTGEQLGLAEQLRSVAPSEPRDFCRSDSSFSASAIFTDETTQSDASIFR